MQPENILISDDDEAKICDFGWSVNQSIDMRTTFCGTYEYMAPEIVENKGYDKKVDIWSLGILLYEMLHGYSPFKGSKMMTILDNIKKGSYRFEEFVSAEARSLIQSILLVDAPKRPSAEKILSSQLMVKYGYYHGPSSPEHIVRPSYSMQSQSGTVDISKHRPIPVYSHRDQSSSRVHQSPAIAHHGQGSSKPNSRTNSMNPLMVKLDSNRSIHESRDESCSRTNHAVQLQLGHNRNKSSNFTNNGLPNHKEGYLKRTNSSSSVAHLINSSAAVSPDLQKGISRLVETSHSRQNSYQNELISPELPPRPQKDQDKPGLEAFKMSPHPTQGCFMVKQKERSRNPLEGRMCHFYTGDKNSCSSSQNIQTPSSNHTNSNQALISNHYSPLLVSSSSYSQHNHNFSRPNPLVHRSQRGEHNTSSSSITIQNRTDFKDQPDCSLHRNNPLMQSFGQRNSNNTSGVMNTDGPRGSDRRSDSQNLLADIAHRAMGSISQRYRAEEQLEYSLISGRNRVDAENDSFSQHESKTSYAKVVHGKPINKPVGYPTHAQADYKPQNILQTRIFGRLLHNNFGQGQQQANNQ